MQRDFYQMYTKSYFTMSFANILSMPVHSTRNLKKE